MHRIFAAIAVALVSVPCWAADAGWKPTRNVELVIGAQSGGAHDRAGRVLQKLLTETQVLPGSMTVMKLDKEHAKLRAMLADLGMAK